MGATRRTGAEILRSLREISTGVSIATRYKKTPEEAGDLWRLLAALAEKLAREGQDALYDKLGALATTLIQ
jgi:NTP pyrophosphatase (non-canonical NTP hydrolase)